MAESAKSRKYRFTFGPWNISQGADPFGPPVRKKWRSRPKSASTRNSASMAFSAMMTTWSRRSIGRRDEQGRRQVQENTGWRRSLLRIHRPAPVGTSRTINSADPSKRPADRGYALSARNGPWTSPMGRSAAVALCSGWPAKDTYIRRSQGSRHRLPAHPRRG